MERKLTAIFSADVQGYSRLMGADEEATVRTLTAYREVMASLIQQHRGRVVDSPGDNLLAEFASVVDAVQCAVEIQEELKARNAELPNDRKMEFRIGINLGDVIVEGERIYGDGVNIAARLEGLADGGGICISGTVHDHVEGKLPLDFTFQGEQRVKNIAKPVRVYRVEMELGIGVSDVPSAPSPKDSSSASNAPSLPDKPSIAVLPFDNMSNDPEQEYFSDGITEDLITDLSKISGLFVISRNSSFTYKGKAVKPEQVARELGVRYLMEGSVRKSGSRLRINAQLIDTSTDYHVWADRFDGNLEDIFALQDDITQKIVAELKVKLTTNEQQQLERKFTENLEAYDCYLRGMEYLRQDTRLSVAQAREMFERARTLDPRFAAAYARLGHVYWIEWSYQWRQEPEIMDQGMELEQKALDLDDSLGMAHAILSNFYLFRLHHDQAVAEARKVIDLDPNDADGPAQLGFVLNFIGKPEEAIPLFEQAMRLNPQSVGFYHLELGHSYLLMREYEQALARINQSFTDNPNFLAAHYWLTILYAERGQYTEARAEAAVCRELNPQFSLETLQETFTYLYRDPATGDRHIDALLKAGIE